MTTEDESQQQLLMAASKSHAGFLRQVYLFARRGALQQVRNIPGILLDPLML